MTSKFQGERLTLKAKRLLVGVGHPGPFQFIDDTPKKRQKAPSVEINIAFGTADPSLESAYTALSRIFLTERDSLAELVPDYWKYCVREGLSDGPSSCPFSPELTAIPGVASHRGGAPSSPSARTEGGTSSAHEEVRIGQGVRPPRAIFSPQPEFNEAARQLNFGGTLTLSLIVNQDGIPTDIQITAPLGCGLDEKAVRAVQNWRFKPAERDGQPVKVRIAVQLSFN